MKERIGIIGLGKLGICFALNLERAGYDVIGLESNDSRRELIASRELRSSEPHVDELLRSSTSFHVARDLNQILSDDSISSIFVLVQTPSLESGEYDHQFLDSVVGEIADFGSLEGERDLVIVCTTMPGKCDEIAARLGELNWNVIYNPEFIAQGSIIHDQLNPDQILIGCENEIAAERLVRIYKSLVKSDAEYCIMSRQEAEITKIATNCFLTLKISFANSVGDLVKKVGGDPEKVLGAIGSDQRIGGKFLRYGFGYGGPCLPRDNRALQRFAESIGTNLHLSAAADESNAAHLEWQFKEMCDAYPNGKAIYFDSVTYKPGTTILDESQQLALAVKLAKAGRNVVLRESAEVIDAVKAIHGDLFEYEVRSGD